MPGWNGAGECSPGESQKTETGEEKIDMETQENVLPARAVRESQS